MSVSISSAYIKGIQATMYHQGLVNYASVEDAAGDAEALGEAIEHNLPVDRGGLAHEGADPEETAIVAQALAEMAEHEHPEAKVAAIRTALGSLSEGRLTRHSKFAAESRAPGDNNVTPGHKPGHVAAGESDASGTDHDEELVNAVPNTAHRENVFHSKPGHQANAGRGQIGHEGHHPDAEGNPGQHRDHQRELSNAVPNTVARKNVHGAPGRQSDGGKGTIGTEKGASLSAILARL